MKKLLVISLSILFIGGCATGSIDCDSRNQDASLFNKINCDHSGAYAAQVQRSADALADARVENEAFRQFYELTKREQQMTAMTLAQRQAQDKALQYSLESVLLQVRRRSNVNADVQRQLASLDNELAEMKSAPAAVTSAQLEARKQKQRDLESQVKSLNMQLGF